MKLPPLPTWSERVRVVARTDAWVEVWPGPIVSRPMAGDVCAVYTLLDDEDMQPMTPEQRGALDLSDGQLHVLAVRNVIADLQPIERDGHAGAWTLSEPGGYEESLLFVPAVWEWVDPWLLGDPVACLPSRDVLLVTGAEDASGLNRVREAAEAVLAEDHDPLSATLLRRDGRRWVVL